MPLGHSSGDPPAPESFEGRLMALMPDLRRYSRSLARSDADGEDLLQDSVERALASRSEWSGINLRGWVLTIMTNLYRNGTRRSRRFPAVDIVEAEDMPDVAANSLSIAFGNFAAGYLIADRGETRILRDPFSNKPFVHFYATKRVGGAIIDSQAIKLMKFAAS